MQEIKDEHTLTKIEDGKIYRNCHFRLSDQYETELETAQFYNCTFSCQALKIKLGKMAIFEGSVNGKLFLDLSNLGLTDIPAYVFQIGGLYHLDLMNNQISKVPMQISYLTSLEYLRLADNQITQLPKEIGQLKKLWWLYLQNNQLTELPKEIGALVALRALNASHNKLHSLPSTIKNLKQVNKMVLSHNNITTIPEELMGMTKLSELYLEHNQFQRYPQLGKFRFQLSKFGLENNLYNATTETIVDDMPTPADVRNESGEKNLSDAELLDQITQDTGDASIIKLANEVDALDFEITTTAEKEVDNWFDELDETEEEEIARRVREAIEFIEDDEDDEAQVEQIEVDGFYRFKEIVIDRMKDIAFWVFIAPALFVMYVLEKQYQKK